MPITVEVTQEDIDRGLASNSQSCPVALAFRRVLTYHINLIIVGPTFVELYHWKNGHQVIELDEITRRNISDFDHHRRIAPFTFIIDVPRYIL